MSLPVAFMRFVTALTLFLSAVNIVGQPVVFFPKHSIVVSAMPNVCAIAVIAFTSSQLQKDLPFSPIDSSLGFHIC